MMISIASFHQGAPAVATMQASATQPMSLFEIQSIQSLNYGAATAAATAAPASPTAPVTVDLGHKHPEWADANREAGKAYPKGLCRRAVAAQVCENGFLNAGKPAEERVSMRPWVDTVPQCTVGDRDAAVAAFGELGLASGESLDQCRHALECALFQASGESVGAEYNPCHPCSGEEVSVMKMIDGEEVETTMPSCFPYTKCCDGVNSGAQ